MAASAEKIVLFNDKKLDGTNEEISEILSKRKSNELVMGFAGPVGCGLSQVVGEHKFALENEGYTVHIIKLSKVIEDYLEKENINSELESDLNLSKYTTSAKRILRLQEGGNRMRKSSGSILAQHAISQIVMLRGEQRDTIEGTSKDKTENQQEEIKNIMSFVPRRTAYLIDQIKNQDEVSLLRLVYGDLFQLIGIISIEEKRKTRLLTSDNVASGEISILIERDRKQKEKHEQQLDKALQMADFFISTDHGGILALKKKIARFLGLLHGRNGLTPTAQEYGMYAAYSAGLKSACLSRQVGAAIADSNGKIVSTGCNDVPKPLGGLYVAEDDTNDRRCVHHEAQVCFNDREKKTHKANIEAALKNLKDENNNPLININNIGNILDKIYEASHIEDLTEFSRAVHAEMDAIISLARSGTPGIVGANLFTTTFPCHSCARHIVAAGIVKVYYIEPYEKSLAKKLHSDAIAFEIEDDDVARSQVIPPRTLVKFIHFEGVAPRQYPNMFLMGDKKRKQDGIVIKIVPHDAPKITGEFLDSYREFETKVVDKLSKKKIVT